LASEFARSRFTHGSRKYAKRKALVPRVVAGTLSAFRQAVTVCPETPQERRWLGWIRGEPL
jgi:hypothetical protein